MLKLHKITFFLLINMILVPHLVAIVIEVLVNYFLIILIIMIIIVDAMAVVILDLVRERVMIAFWAVVVIIVVDSILGCRIFIYLAYLPVKVDLFWIIGIIEIHLFLC